MNLPPPGGALDATVRDFLPGQKLFNRYVLKRILGRGGMGVVWLARDDVLDREVALKFLPDVVFYDRGMLDDLKRETNRSLELTHKNIVRINDFVHDESSGCISMEYVDGDTISNIRADRPLRVFECWELGDWMRQLCEALDYAHNHARVVHRDLKPSNLMVNLRGELKVTDFGIARSLSDSVSMLTVGKRHTSGTLVYMSPQQLDGARGSHFDDIYSLGATLYELLTSKPPFFSGNIDRQIHERKPPMMSFRREELDIVGGEPIDPVWEEVIAACLQKDPAQRPQSALEVIERLTAPAPRTSSILSGWFPSSKTATKSEHKTRGTARPATKPRTATTQPVISPPRPPREPSYIFRRTWAAITTACSRAAIATAHAMTLVFVVPARATLHGISASIRFVGRGLAAIIRGIQTAVIGVGRGSVFAITSVAKGMWRTIVAAAPIAQRAARVIATGVDATGRAIRTTTLFTIKESARGAVITAVPAVLVAVGIWFFAIRTPPPSRAVAEKKPQVGQFTQQETNIGLIEPKVPAAHAPAPPPPAPRVGGLSLATVPTGAKIVVDGSIVNTAPVLVPNLPIGKHHLQVTLANYVTEERDVDVTESTSQEIITLRPVPPPMPAPPPVTADGFSKPASNRAEQEQAPVVKKVVRNRPVPSQKPPPPSARQAVAATQPAPPAKPIPKSTPKTETQQRRPQQFEGTAPGG